MPFTEFCCRSGGSNLNAGTRTGDSTEPSVSPVFTYASGSWVASTGVFTVASGDPLSDGVAVGDFASVYADGATVTGFVGRVTARNATTITVSLTAKSGTAPTDGTGNRTLRIGGAWAGPSSGVTFPIQFIEVTCTNATGEHPRVNFKNDNTYAVSTTTFTINTPQNNCTFQGYSNSYGDFGRATISTSITSGSLITFGSAGAASIVDFILLGTAASGTSEGLRMNGAVAAIRVATSQFRLRGILALGASLVYECEADRIAGTSEGFYASGSSVWVRCIAHDCVGRGFTIDSSNVNSVALLDCISDSNGSDGFRIAGGTQLLMKGCDSYNNAANGLNISSASSSIVRIESCNFVKNSGWGITGAGVNVRAEIFNCGFGAGTQANTSGLVSTAITSTQVGSVTYGNDMTPWVNPANGDFRISLEAAKSAGRGQFTQTQSGYSGTIGYPDIGAAQSKGGGIRQVNIRGGADQ